MLIHIAIKVIAPNLDVHFLNVSRCFEQVGRVRPTFKPNLYQNGQRIAFETAHTNNLTNDMLNTLELYAQVETQTDIPMWLALQFWAKTLTGAVQLAYAQQYIQPKTRQPYTAIYGVRFGYKNTHYKQTDYNVPYPLAEYDFYNRIQQPKFWDRIFEQVAPQIQPQREKAKARSYDFEQASLF
jgi:hypothetical protein